MREEEGGAHPEQHAGASSRAVYRAVMWIICGVFFALWIGLWVVERRPGGLVQAFLVIAIAVAIMNWVAHYRTEGED